MTTRSTVRPPGSATSTMTFASKRLGRRALGQSRRNVGMALGVGLQLVVELIADRGEFVVGQAAGKSLIARDFRAIDRLQRHLAGHVEAGGRRAVEEFRVERDLRPARPASGCPPPA